MPTYDIFVLGESQLSISGGAILDGVSQGDGSHLVGRKITLNSNAWMPVSINDNDPDFSDNDGSQRLNGTQTVDGVSFADATRVEAEYGLTLTDGTNSWTVVEFNVNTSNPNFGTIEGLAFIGGPGGFPPVGVPMTVSNAFEGPNFAQSAYATPICFTTGTGVATPQGLRAVETLRPGMQVITRGHGPREVLWTGRRRVMAVQGCAPVRIAAGALGNSAAGAVSRQHRVLGSGWRAEMLFGEPAVLVPAVHLLGRPGVTSPEGGIVGYHHILLEQHAVMCTADLWSERFHAGPSAMEALLPETRADFQRRFSEHLNAPLAYPSLRGHEAAVLHPSAA